MKVAVIGANGQLGRDVVDVLAEQETEVPLKRMTYVWHRTRHA